MGHKVVCISDGRMEYISDIKNIVCLSADGEETSLGKVSLATKLVEII